jgi:3-carboxy-cis,cis-muconate cycloisomerase
MPDCVRDHNWPTHGKNVLATGTMPGFTGPSPLFLPIFGSAAVAEAFSDRAIVQAMLDFEAALAAAEAEVGIVPAACVAPIRSACDASLFDIAEIGRAAGPAGNVAIPLVKALTAKVNEKARGYVHWGGTSQDVIDTAFALCAKRAMPHIRGELSAAMDALVALIGEHRATIMPGRTLMQQALPITFAFKAAVWLSALTGAAARLRRAQTDSLALQFAGAAGTLAALGEDGVKVKSALAKQLGLNEAPITWHSERGRILDIAAALAGLSGASAKIANDVLLLMQSEVGEAFEPAAAGKGGSSTLPHKRNPVGAAAIRANHRRISGLMATITIGLEQEHERAPGAWAAEWETQRELFCLAAGSIERLAEMLAGLDVDPARMRANLDATLGLPLTESLMMALAPKIGRMEAHHRIEAASKLALSSNRPLAEVAKAEPAIASNLSSEEIDRALDPRHYLGSTEAMIEAALVEARSEMEST